MANNHRKIPINRNNTFFSEDEFDLEIEMGREFAEGDLNMTVILFKVDRKRTQKDSTYNESNQDEIKYHPPIELRVVPVIEEPTNAGYNPNNTGRYLEDGNLTFGVYQKQLKEKNTDIDFGDYVGYAVDEDTVRYFTVSNDGKKFYDNTHTILGYKGAFRTIVCSPVDESEFRGY